jgi:hypothetical protein
MFSLHRSRASNKIIKKLNEGGGGVFGLNGFYKNRGVSKIFLGFCRQGFKFVGLEGEKMDLIPLNRTNYHFKGLVK